MPAAPVARRRRGRTPARVRNQARWSISLSQRLHRETPQAPPMHPLVGSPAAGIQWERRPRQRCEQWVQFVYLPEEEDLERSMTQAGLRKAQDPRTKKLNSNATFEGFKSNRWPAQHWRCRIRACRDIFSVLEPNACQRELGRGHIVHGRAMTTK